MVMIRVLRAAFGAACALLMLPPAWGLESDSGEPIFIEANQATFDETTGETVYNGDVQATQGSLVVNSDQMTVYQKDSKTEKVVAIGRPVRLKQTPEGGGDDLNGVAQRAEYFPDTGILILLERAVVTQGTMTTESDRIEYDSAKGVAKAGSTASSNKRVHVTLQPKEK